MNTLCKVCGRAIEVYKDGRFRNHTDPKHGGRCEMSLKESQLEANRQ